MDYAVLPGGGRPLEGTHGQAQGAGPTLLLAQLQAMVATAEDTAAFENFLGSGCKCSWQLKQAENQAR